MKKFASLIAVFCFLQTAAQDTLSKNDIPAAARLLDLQFTQKEIDTMYDGVKENLAGYRLLHKETLNNNVPMTLLHSPVLPGMHFNEKQEPINWNLSTKVQIPANINDLAFY